MKILIHVCIIFLISILCVNGIQAQFDISAIKPMSMKIDKISSQCFEVEITTLIISEEISIYTINGNNDFGYFPITTHVVADYSTTCYGRVCFDDNTPLEGMLEERMIYCSAKQNENLLQDGCSVLIGP